MTQVVVVPLFASRYAVDATKVRDVVHMPRLAPLPDSPAAVLGLFNLRGEIVPLFDTAHLVGAGDAADGDTFAYAVVVDTAAGPAGLTATALPATERLGREVGVTDTFGVSGTFEAGETVVALLDVDTLLVSQET